MFLHLLVQVEAHRDGLLPCNTQHGAYEQQWTVLRTQPCLPSLGVKEQWMMARQVRSYHLAGQLLMCISM